MSIIVVRISCNAVIDFGNPHTWGSLYLGTYTWGL